MFLAAVRHRRALMAWTLAVGGTFACILLLKLIFGIVPALGAPLAVRSPSGHTACATATYGGLVILVAGRWAGRCSAVLVACAMGASRVALGLHTLPEVLIGAAVGIGAIVGIGAGSPILSRRDAALLITLAGLIVAAGHGRHASVEPALVDLENSLRF